MQVIIQLPALPHVNGTQTPGAPWQSFTVLSMGGASLFTDSSDQKTTQLTALQPKYLYPLNLFRDVARASSPPCNSSQLHGMPVTALERYLKKKH